MIDVSDLKSRINLIDFCGREIDLRRKGARESTGACPFCGGDDRFNVQADKWLCRNCTQGKWQDVIAYVMRRDNCDFLTACNTLTSLPLNAPSVPIASSVRTSKPSGEPDPLWQNTVREIIDDCQQTLWSDEGANARQYLTQRGLKYETIWARWLGLCLGLPKGYRTLRGLSVPCGITIPRIIGGAVWCVNVRRAQGLPKYEQIAGGRSALYGADTLAGKRTAVITEGEFDAMLLAQECGDLVGVATMGGATTYPDDAMMRHLLPVASWLIALDVDDPGNTGAKWWTDKSARARRVFIPKIAEHVKDVSDFHIAGGDLREWVCNQANIKRYAYYYRNCVDPLYFEWLTLEEIRAIDPRQANLAEMTQRIRDAEKVTNYA